ncbi:MAG: glycoside hydrolase family 3 C-terminal domain-containing protein [Candidatus Marinimicrobia bacterium]|nr:glycoside hydrolase family 3 C-terminal domain-containing protein [Candidatus Neomarinimicrobiota bacterium]
MKTLKLFYLFLLFTVCGAEERSIKDQFISDLLDKMTLEEKVGQMTQVDKRMLDSEEDIATYFIGSILSGGGSVPEDNSPKGWVNMINAFQRQALSTRLKIPLIYGIDAVHGHSNVVGATIFPHNIGLGCVNDPGLIYDVNHATAVEVAATGLHWTFSPCVTVPRDDRWGRQYEGYSESPELVSGLTGAAINGYEDGIDIFGGRKIASCAKHFLGDGGTTWETGKHNEGGRIYKIDRGDTRLTEGEIRRIHLPPYLEAIKAGVKTVMISFNSWNGVKCHGNKFLINDLLKEELGFKGLVVSDWAGIDEIPGDYKSDVITSINAGIDLVMVPGSLYHYKTFIQYLTEGVQEGSVPISRINDAVRRILSVKYDLGLFEAQYADPKHAEVLGSAVHRKIARTAVQKSMVLMKNENNVLPLNKNAGITVVGSGANNIGIQNGGWTVEWQGRMTPDFLILDQNRNGSIERSEVLDYSRSIYDEKFDLSGAEGFFNSMDLNSNGIVDKTEIEQQRKKSPFQPYGTTILEALQDVIKHNKGSVTYDPLADKLPQGNTIVAVVGEHPYSEGYGDNPSIGLNSFDKKILEKCYKSGNKIVVVILSGRPLMIEKHIDNWDALIAAWLPGMAGEGVADVLFGDYNPTGKLSYTWPRNINQLPINIGDKDYDPLFPFGHGLSYTSFTYSDLDVKLSKNTNQVTVNVTVKNTGKRDGKEAVQLYIRDHVASVSRPLKELKKFQKISLDAGKKQSVKFILTEDDFSYYNNGIELVFEPGDFTIMVGGNSVDVLTHSFKL